MNSKRILAVILTLLMLLMSACGSYAPDIPNPPDTQSQTQATDATEPTSDLQAESQTTPPTEAEADDTSTLRENLPVYGEYYYDVVNVVLYLELYNELPPNYITKDEARELGWQGGSVEKYREGAAIGGDYFGNFEGLLPSAAGRKFTECDIDTNGYSSRGSRRLIFSNDGLYFYTSDHYESFSEVKITEDYEVTW